jgi:SAM-dependent methyltransferase
MGWRLKSFQFKVFSALPGGTRLYNFAQDNITKSTHASVPRVDQKIQVGLEFWDWLKSQNMSERLVRGRLLDIGSGWHPTIPLLWHSFGNDQQTLVDICPNMNARQVADTIKHFREIVENPNWSHRSAIKRLPEKPADSAIDAASSLKPLGIRYEAPYGDHLQRSPDHFDMVICTQVLQHIPKAVHLQIFKELFHCMKPGGVFHATVHFVGQFRSPHLRAGQYEHLTPSPALWNNWINSSMMGFNRLKGPDYRETLEQSGFRIREFKLTEPTSDDLAELRRTKVHPSFSRYSELELATRGVFFVAEKP